VFRIDTPPFDDPRVRRALTLAVDRVALADKVYLRQAELATDLLLLESPFHHRTPLAPLDLQAAGQILDAASWRAGPDGMRRRAGVPLTIVLTCIAGDAAMLRNAVELQSAWHQIGIDISLRPLPTNVLLSPTGTFARGNFSVALDSYSFPITPDRSELLTTRALPPHGYNYSRLRDPVLDRLMAQAHHSLDSGLRKRLYAQIDARIAAEIPVYPLVWRKAIFAVSTRIDGIRPEPINSDLWDAAAWRVR
jgi:peptide/nickel transport system substrate-binding protein